MEMRKGLLGVAVTLAVTGLGLWSGTEASAAETTYNNYTDALTGAPQGVDLNSDEYKDYFWHGDDATGATGTNSATLVDAGTTGSNNSAIQISRAGVKNSWGAIWSNDKVFDLMKPETASMWVYASTEAAYTKDGLGDGMAFVLQNSDDGVHAFSKAAMPDKDKNNVYTPGVGESMGVWGMDPRDWNSTDLAKNAISNSWALEFDTFNNTFVPSAPFAAISQWDLDAPYAPSSFDLGSYYNSFDSSGNPTGTAGKINSDDNHIASNYPADSSTYTGMTQNGYRGEIWGKTGGLLGLPYWAESRYETNYYYYKMTHLGYLDEGKTTDSTTDKLTDHRWHHVTLTYTPPTSSDGIGKMKYVYDDKNSDTGEEKTPANSAEVPIKLSEFNLTDSTKVRWGFTGSTGTSTENNLVVFDQVPGDVENSSTATLSTQDESGDYTPVDTSGTSTPTISGGEPVKLDYTFQRDGGLKDWEGVNALLTIPKSIHLTSGKITNPDGSDGGSVDISKLNGTSLPVAMGNSDNGVNLTGTQEGKITLYGTATDTASTEGSTTNYFQGSNASSSADLTGFKVAQSKISMAVDPTNGTLKVNYGGKTDADIVGVVKSTDTTVSPTNVTIHPVLNGVAQDSFIQGDVDHYNPNYGTTGFHYLIPNAKLKAGSNTVTFYATDTNPSDGRSPVISQEVIAGTVELGNVNDMSFGKMALTGADTTLSRDGTWGLNVTDSRMKNSTWQLNAYADPLMTDATQTAVSTKLDGYLVYPDANGVDEPLGTSPGTATKIASGTSGDTTTTTNIASDWTDNSGIRLVVGGGATAGSYSGNINWTFVNSEPTT
ncbi:hypothetical protein [Levilactobacillus sp. N40-8-2]|uniref:hypothetical protein n=1 Tax=Levilactobacillus muriae TaxID=3238987 RepID=UPI0038B31C6B